MAISQNELFYVALSHNPKFGPASMGQILHNKKDYKKLFNGTKKDFSDLKFTDKTIDHFFSIREKIDLGKIDEIIKKEKVQIVTPKTEAYPELLKELHTPPAILFCRGDLSTLKGLKISIVGTRKPTHYGRESTIQIIKSMQKTSVRIVSGLALGVDAEAHQAALDNDLFTIAVLGTGVNNKNIYPKHNYNLAQDIINSGGLLVSEFPFGTVGHKHHFPQRNRIISGLSKLTIVVEAAKRSGALITVHLALEQNRDVMALPGNINNKLAFGPNSLIKQGANPIIDINDVAEELDLKEKINYSKKSEIIPPTQEESLILKHLSSEAVHVDELTRLTKLSVSAINSTLTLMEIKGMVKNIGNMNYIIIN